MYTLILWEQKIRAIFCTWVVSTVLFFPFSTQKATDCLDTCTGDTRNLFQNFSSAETLFILTPPYFISIYYPGPNPLFTTCGLKNDNFDCLFRVNCDSSSWAYWNVNEFPILTSGESGNQNLGFGNMYLCNVKKWV